ncbi:MAG: hypothetical protein M1827_007473 [Pycnora praestabilis]|nr:MAG: hypothetical protein M1827_007473 [Pycnora praestabilis]
MHPLNPFLRAFFRSTLPAQCTPVQHHILLVPTTEVLLTSRDRESNSLLADLAGSEEFLGSHVLRVPGAATSSNGKDGGNVRDTRGKAKQYTTVNGRTVVVKDTFVYSNKGFKTLNQAQVLNDAIYYPDVLDAQQWLIYYISKPLLGSVDVINIIPASLPDRSAYAEGSSSSREEALSASVSRKKDIKSFSDLLNYFPMIARQMQPGLERLFKEFGATFETPLPALPLQASTPISKRKGSVPSESETLMSSKSSQSNGHVKSPSKFESYIEEDEDLMRNTLETAVTVAIDLFQLVDKQQLSLLGATTDLTGPLVERLIERYVTEQVHDNILFPRLCAARRLEDLELESRVKQMENVDISQVGIPIEGGRQGKQELILRLGRGVNEFRKLGVAGSPQEMLDILLATEKMVTMASTGKEKESRSTDSEKPSTVLTINADTLVSLLLVVVIRSQIRHLQARLAYMRYFIFIDDVEGGEIGYALSTFEAVLSYLTRDSGGLRRASRTNKRLWQATKNGQIREMSAILEPQADVVEDFGIVEEPEEMEDTKLTEKEGSEDASNGDQLILTNGSTSYDLESTISTSIDDVSDSSTLAHVFPFHAQTDASPAVEDVPRRRKRVSMDAGSMVSSWSGHSFTSRTTTIDSRGSGIEGDTSVEKISMTQDSSGDSVVMMAIEHRQPQALRYLLSLSEYYSHETILEDMNNEGVSLLSAAIQLGHTEVIDILLDFVLHAPDARTIELYFEKQDHRGRTAAHYIFTAPHLIPRIGRMLPWRLRDKIGQTPLFALCRSYDHSQYKEMVEHGLQIAKDTQQDGLPLHLDDHVDGKGNTLLHVVNDSQLARMILYNCDSDVNATNDKRFTPLMVASKYGRVDMVRALFGDPRVDLYAKEHRGLTAVELAKDDEVRNRIDDLVLFSNTAADDGRITTVVRSFFVEDATIRLVVKSGAPNSNHTFTVTTCRRSLTDFENLAKWLSVEHPASWLPSIFNFRSPFQVPSKPSRAVLREIQIRLDHFLKIMLAHSTFSTHEMLWEFFLVPDIQPDMMAERSKKKAETRLEKVKEEYAPVVDVRDIELFVGHAKEMVRGVNHSTKSVVRRVNKLQTITTDLSDAQLLSSRAFCTLNFLPEIHITAFTRYTHTLHPTDSSPYATFLSDMQSISLTITAILASLTRPTTLITSMTSTSKAIDRHLSSLRRSDRWPLGLLDDTRNKIHLEAADKVERSKSELKILGCELRYTQQCVAGELAGWQELHERMGRRAIRGLVKRMVVGERARLEGMRRAVRGLGLKEKGEAKVVGTVRELRRSEI